MNETMYNIKYTFAKESPSILTAFGVVGMVSTTVLAVRATPKALELLESEAYRNKVDIHELEPLEKIKAAWKPYIPSILLGSLTAACILGANSIHLKRNAALASVYSIAAAGLKEYQEKVVETIGEKKELKIRDDIAQDRLDANPLGERELVLAGGDALFYDSLSGRYFRSNVETIRKAQNDFNVELMTDMFKSSNDWFDMLDLKHVDMGNAQGWDIDSGLLDVQFSTKLAENNEPCIVLMYSARPKYC